MPGDHVEEIKNKLDLKDVVGGYLKLEKRGVNYRARCPFHNEKTPSFFVSPSRQLWRCFGCGEGGDMFTFVQRIEGVDFPEALRTLASAAGVQLRPQDPRIRSEKNKNLEICELAAKYFNHQLESKNGQHIVEYLKARGIKESSVTHFRLGYAPYNSKSLVVFLKERGFSATDAVKAGLVFRAERTGEHLSRFRGRMMFPIFNISGDVVGFGGRVLTDEVARSMGRTIPKDTAKYINTPQTTIYNKSSILYGLDRAKIPIRQQDACIIVEGYTDVIMAHQEGYKNVVSSSGTALTEQQLNIIGRFTKNLLTCFDMDIAGDTATKRGIDLAQSMEFDIRVITLADGSDPADVIQQDKKEWDERVTRAKSVTEFYFDSAFSKHDASTPEGKRKIGNLLAPVLKNIPSRIEQAHWVQRLALKLKVGEEAVWEDIKRTTQTKKYFRPETPKQEDEQLSRKDLLARHILLHLLKNPSLSSRIKKILSTGGWRGTVMTLVKRFLDISNADDIKKALNKLKGKKRALVDQILFESEIRGDQEFSQESLHILLSSYQKLILDEELKGLEQKISENEAIGSVEENKKLLRDFHAKVAQRAQF